MKAKAGLQIARIGILCLSVCAGPAMQGQTAPAAAPPAGASFQDSSNDLSVAVGKTVLVDTAKPMARVAIGLGDVAEADAISPTEIMVMGKAAGETSLIIWDTSGGRQFFNVTVRAPAAVSNDNLDAVRRELRNELPGQALKVSSENGNLFLRGTVKDMESSARAVRIASTAGKVVNLLFVDVPPATPQILLKVRFASVDRSKLKELGINLFSTGLGNTVGGISTGQFSPPTITSSGGVTSVSFANELNFLALFPGLNGGASIQALESKGVVEVLSEPNLLAQDGREASFLAGGEYPYPVVQGGGAGTPATVTIQFKEYGIRLNFIPTITARGSIRLQVAPEVSSLDFTNAVEIGGFDVPAINVRKVNTEVELADRETFVIGGLLDKRENDTFEKIPFLGDIPVLGKFFQSMQKNKTDTELIVIVTPELVNPIPAGGTIPALNYPREFLPPNSGIPMHTPDERTAAAAPAPSTVSVEKMTDSMKPEMPLIIEGSNGTFGSGGTSNTPTTSAPAPAPQ